MTNIEEYDIGDGVRIQTTFTIDNVPTNPTTVTLFVKDPSGNSDTHAHGTLTNPSTGVWYKDITADEQGTWHARMTGTGAVTAAAQQTFLVRRSLA